MKWLMVLWFFGGLLPGIDAEAVATPPPAGTDQEAKASPPLRQGKTRHRAVKPQRGKASYYSRKFAGKKTASGAPLNPRAHVAASKTLPLGTQAKVTNLKTGKSTMVRIEDRGPYEKNRIIDVSPKAAEELEMKKEGVAPVQVTPVEIPPPRGAPEGWQ
ncbi:MAG: septal ring lytic transglycosylase RlpA family protein [Rhodocyclaceae bacterium]|nr:septal ring lytic transglycosylase RlpA family protein [Rhodocyclaceae bacterium]